MAHKAELGKRRSAHGPQIHTDIPQIARTPRYVHSYIHVYCLYEEGAPKRGRTSCK